MSLTNTAKKPRLENVSDRIRILPLGGGKHVSTNAKLAMLKDLRDLGVIPEDMRLTRWQIEKEKQEIISRRTPFGPLLQEREFMLGDNTRHKFPIQHPQSMLYIALSTSDRYSKYARDAIAEHGEPANDRPWSLVLYFDDITCGKELALGHKRQVTAVYWTLYQLGMQALSDEACWFELVAFRTAETKHFDGCVSHLVEVCLGCFFDSASCDFRSGLTFHVKDYGTIMLVMVLEMIIADAKALIDAIGALGVNAVLPCFLCRRIVSFDAKQKPLLADKPELVTLDCLDSSKWGKHTDTSLKNTLKELADIAGSGVSNASLKKSQTARGFKHVPNNFLLNASLAIKGVSILMLDWMHLFFQTGNWNREVWQIFRSATKNALPSYDECAKYVDLWVFPSRGPSVHKLMSAEHKKSCTDGGYFKCQASQGLSLYPVMSKFFVDVVLPVVRQRNLPCIEAQIVSYVRLCDVVDLLSVSKNGIEISPDKLDKALISWGNALTTAYGCDMWYWKTHGGQHLGDLLRKRQANHQKAYLPACWFQDI